MARHFGTAVPEVWGRPLAMNVSMPIAAVMLDLSFPRTAVKGVPLLARTASLIAHLAEEQGNQIGFLMAGIAEDAIAYEAEETAE
jgi:citrate synthase